MAAAVAGPALGPGQGPAHRGPAGLVLAPGPAQSLVTGPGDLARRIALVRRIAPGLDPGLEPGGPGAEDDDAKFWTARIHVACSRPGFPFLSRTIEDIGTTFFSLKSTI